MKKNKTYKIEEVKPTDTKELPVEEIKEALEEVIEEPIAMVSPITVVSMTVRVENPYLNIRTGPGTNFDKVGYVGTGDFEVTGITDGAGSKAGWAHLADNRGWISMDHAVLLGD